MEWVLAGVAFLVCWPTGFYFGLVMDEDVNHWNWPNDDGPGAWGTTRIAVISAVGALLLGSAVWAIAHALQ